MPLFKVMMSSLFYQHDMGYPSAMGVYLSSSRLWTFICCYSSHTAIIKDQVIHIYTAWYIRLFYYVMCVGDWIQQG